MKEISVIFTCYNRRKKTVAAMQSLVNGNKNIHFHFIIVDDMSTDDTINAIKNLKYDTTIISGTGNLYWCGGMRKGIQFFLDSDDTNDCMLINDDVSFFDNAVVQLVALLDTWKDAVIVGATCDKTGKFTYGLRKKGAIGVRLERIEPNEKGIEGDTMNANCVLLPNHILREVGNIDSYYTHSLGDYDLGFQIRKRGYKLISSYDYVGICEGNTEENTWNDITLTRLERLKLKEMPKGSPCNEWFHFLHKNYSLLIAVVFSVYAYLKILFKK